MTTTAPTELHEVDREALQRAIDMTLADPDPGRIRQIKQMLKERDWFDVATFASYHQQTKNLECKPWESPPCWITSDVTVEPQYLEIGKRLVQAGLSIFEPDPLQALSRPVKRKR